MAILLQAKMSARFMIIVEVLLEHPPKMSIIENDRMVQAFPSDRADHPLNVRILPRAIEWNE